MAARFKLSLDAMVVTGEIEMHGNVFQPGDFMFSDGSKTWCVPHDVVVQGAHYKPSGAGAKALIEKAKNHRKNPTPNQESLA